MYQGIALIDANIIRNDFTSTGKTGNCAELSFFNLRQHPLMALVFKHGARSSEFAIGG